MNKKKKIIVGLSGGVDSSVTAYLLKKQGHDVLAVHMQNWESENNDPFCSATEDLSDAKAVCNYLGIKLIVLNFAREYWQRVFDHCLNEFNAGRTPNPDIYCNQEIKFRCLLHWVLEQDYEFLATGHYVKNLKAADGFYQLHKGDDKEKDQSYFLYTLGQEQLSHCLFPLGDYKKSEIRQLAKETGLPTFNKKDSTGLCFIGERKFKDFLKEFLLIKPGNIVNEKETIIGQHDGLMFYTIGQRKGLNIGGQKNAPEEPWYVLEKNVEKNVLIVGQGHQNPKLFNTKLYCTNVTWVCRQAPTLPFTCSAKIRYRQLDQVCKVYYFKENILEVEFEEKQRAITKGQSIVFYQGTNCLGGGIIE